MIQAEPMSDSEPAFHDDSAASTPAVGEITRMLSTEAVIGVESVDWALATVLAVLRLSSNQKPGQYRTLGQDRGPTQNFLGDVQGALGELLLLRELDAMLPPNAHVAHCLYHPGGGGATEVSRSVDAEITFAEEMVEAVNHRTRRAVSRPARRPRLQLLLEAKCHLDLPSALADRLRVPMKKDFAVNHQAVFDSHRLGATGFVPYITVLGGRKAIRGRIIFLADALRWPVVEYSSSKDLALAVPLDEFVRVSAGRTLKHVRKELGDAFAAMGLSTIKKIAEGAARNRSDERLSELSQLSVRDARALLAVLAREWYVQP